MLPFALFGLIALCAADAAGASAQQRSPSAGWRRTPRAAARVERPRLALLIVLGGWFLVEAVVLSLSKGIVHPYYVSALGPGVAAMVGAGAFAFVELRAPRATARRRCCSLRAPSAATVAVQIVLLHSEHYMLLVHRRC